MTKLHTTRRRLLKTAAAGGLLAATPLATRFASAQSGAPIKIGFQQHSTGIGAALQPGWTMNDEWYSFGNNPRDSGAQVLATLDEGSYTPVGRGGQDLRMGEDHPIAWTKCVGKGRAMYSAIGHRPEVYHIPENLLLLRDALVWAAGDGCL